MEIQKEIARKEMERRLTLMQQIYPVKSCKAGTVPIRYIGIISQGEH